MQLRGNIPTIETSSFDDTRREDVSIINQEWPIIRSPRLTKHRICILIR